MLDSDYSFELFYCLSASKYEAPEVIVLNNSPDVMLPICYQITGGHHYQAVMGI